MLSQLYNEPSMRPDARLLPGYPSNFDPDMAARGKAINDLVEKIPLNTAKYIGANQRDFYEGTPTDIEKNYIFLAKHRMRT